MGCLILKEAAQAEIVIKKSRFIATMQPAHTEEEAAEFIAATKKKYWDARHNCSAFVIGSSPEITRCSDDGEPSGTAGRPMLEVLLGSGIKDAAVVVTRYFGGVLLGTGGLVRAYSQAVSDVIEKAEVLERYDGALIAIDTDYSDIGKVLRIISEQGLAPSDTEYGADVKAEVIVPAEDADSFIKKLTDATNGKASVRIKEKGEYTRRTK